MKEFWNEIGHYVDSETNNLFLESGLTNIEFADAYWYIRKENSDVLKCSKAIWEILGYKQPSLQNPNINNFLSPVERQIAIHNVESYFNYPTGRFKDTLKFQQADGSYVWIERSGRLITTKNTDEQILAGTITNVTDQKKEELDYITLRKELEEISQHSPVILFQFEMDTYQKMSIPFIANGILNLFSNETVQSLKTNVQEFFNRIYPLDAKALEDGIHKSRAHGTPWEFDFKISTPGGKTKWYQCNAGTPIYRPDSSTVWHGHIKEITKKKRREEKLLLFESVVSNANDSIVITNADMESDEGPTIVYVNPAFERLTGYCSDEILGESPRILQGEKSNKEGLAKLKEAMDKWETCDVETINYKKNGETFWARFNVVPVFNQSNELSHWISIEQDVTEEKNKQIALEEQNKKLREITWLQSHVVRAPLARLMGLVNLLNNNNAEASELLPLIEISAKELDDIIISIIKKSEEVNFLKPISGE